MGKVGRVVALAATVGVAVTGAAPATPVGVSDAAAADPATSFTVTPHAWVSALDERTGGPSSMRFCGNRDPGSSSRRCTGRWSSEQHWAVAASSDPQWPQAGFGLNDGPANAPARVGEPFVLAEFGNWNPMTRGDTPVTLAIHGDVVVQPPAGPPVTISLERLPRNTRYISGFYFRFLETDNAPPCLPEYQTSDTPCDDLFTLVGSPFPADDQGLVSSADAGGVHWELEVLGWDDLRGGTTRRIFTEEETETVRSMFARITASTTATTTALGSDRATSTAGEPVTLTAAVTPAPSTGGTVAFSDGGTPVAGCEAVPVDVRDGTASCVTSALAEGARSLTATFSGVVGFSGSASAPAHVTVAAPPGGGGGTNPPGGGGGGGDRPGTHPGPGGGDRGEDPAHPGARPRLTVQRTTRSALLRRGVAVSVSGRGRARLRLLDGGRVVSRTVFVRLTARRRVVRLRPTRAVRRLIAHGRKRRLVVELRPEGGRPLVRKRVVVRAPQVSDARA
jgi:hypothetical protein